MRWVLFTLLLITVTVYCSEDESNEVLIGPSIKPPVNLDSNLRKALLKALVELENEEKENHERNTRNDYVNIITHLDTNGKNVEKAPASALSYYTQTEPVNMTVTVKKSTSRPKQIVVIQKSKGTQHETIHEIEDLDLSESPEQFIASASTSFTSSKSKSGKTDNTKSVSGGAQFNSLTSRGKTKKSKTPQTTTTPRPTTSTEESEANVESLQFFSAPLVAAFTVHQDEKGLPRSVVPIYNQIGITTTTTEKHQPEETKIKSEEELRKEVLKQQKELEVRQEEELKKKQNKLEDEIRRLTKLKEEQERIIKEQKFAYEQKLFEHQKKLFEEQTRLFNNVQPFVPITTTTPRPSIQPSSHLGNNFRPNTLVSIQPSVGFVQPTSSSTLPLNGQVLPVRNAVNFRTPFNQNFGQLRVTQESLPSQNILPFVNRHQNTEFHLQNSVSPLVNTAQNPVIPLTNNNLQNSLFFQSLPSSQRGTLFRQSPSFEQTFSTAHNQHLPFVTQQNPTFRPSEVPSSTPHGTRTLRQESGTGNFLNNRLNSLGGSSNVFTDHRFNRDSFNSQQNSQQAQFFRPNVGLSSPSLSQYNTLQYSVDHQPFVNQRLNNLLYYSGLGQGRQQEDLNIVSKVLSFNHLGGGDSQFPTSSNVDHRIRAPANWRVV